MPPKKTTGKKPSTTDRKGRSAADEKELLAALRQFIRTKGEDYLQDPNTSSIGIGYKIDSVVVEALLGQSDALDDYSRDLQVGAIREKQLANQREVLAREIIATGDANMATLFAQVFAPPPAAPGP